MKRLISAVARVGACLGACIGLAACAAVGESGSKPASASVSGAVPAMSIETMADMVRTLSSDAFEGRAPGTAGEEKTLAYLVEKFEEAGLQPGNNGGWFQDVPLVEITGKDFSKLTIEGGAQPLGFSYGGDYMGGTYRVTPTIDIAGSEMVFVGYGINAPEKGWNDYAGLDMRGKTAVILVNDPDYESEDLEGPFNGRAMTYYGRWTYKYEEAARQGAAAALVVHDTFPAAYGWNVVESSGTGPQAFAQTADDGASETQFNGWIQKSVAERIFAAAGKDFGALSAAARNKGFAPVPLGLRASLSFSNDIRRFTSKNVVGVLPGSERPDEYVLYSAHWDHLGRCKPDGMGDDICNGAVDNATGTAALVALAQAHRKAGAPARSLVFLGLTAEESGLLGSEYYGANPVFPLARTVGGINMDALFPMAPARDVKVIGGGKSELDAVLARAVAEEGRYERPDPTPEKGYYYRSDHFSLAKRGVPMFYVEAGIDLEPGGEAAGTAFADAYTAQRYHAPADEYSEDWVWTGIERELRMFYRLGRLLAESGDWPNWYEGDEFRAIRDESCAAAGGCR